MEIRRFPSLVLAGREPSWGDFPPGLSPAARSCETRIDTAHLPPSAHCVVMEDRVAAEANGDNVLSVKVKTLGDASRVFELKVNRDVSPTHPPCCRLASFFVLVEPRRH